MTNELGTTLSDIEAKAAMRQEALQYLNIAFERLQNIDGYLDWKDELSVIRKYIEEN